MLTLSLNPTYLCNFRCEFCYLTKSQLGDKRTLSLDTLRERLSELENHNLFINHVDLYGGEVALLSQEYLGELDTILETLGDITINVITNLSLVHPYFLEDHVDLSVSFDFDKRQDHEKVLQNIISLRKEVSVLMLASPALMEKNVEKMVDTFNAIRNIRSVEIKPYSTNQANDLGAHFADFENFVLKWLNTNKKKSFEFINEKKIVSAAKGQSNAFSDDHIYITPQGKFAVLEFDDKDREFFHEIDDLSQFNKWKLIEKDRVSKNSFCSKCDYYGSCLTEHYREVQDLRNSCNGFYNLMKWGKSQEKLLNK